MGFQEYLLDSTKGKICMHSIFDKCQRDDCNKEHLTNIKEKNFLKTLMSNVFDSSIIRQTPFYAEGSKCIQCKTDMDKYIESKNLTDKTDIRFKTNDKIKKDVLRMLNQKGKFSVKKTKLSVCSKNIFMKYCNHYQDGNYITLDIILENGNKEKLCFCYNPKYNQDCISICNCNIKLTQSKKTGRYYINSIFNYSKKSGVHLSDYMDDSENTDSKYVKSSIEDPEPEEEEPKDFKMEKESFPIMENTDEIKVNENKVWVNKKQTTKIRCISPLIIDKSGPQREISSSSLSEMSSPIQQEFKTFSSLISQEDIDNIDSTEKMMSVIRLIQLEYDKMRDLSIKYYEKYQSLNLIHDNNELSYSRTIADLKKKLEIQYKTTVACLDEFSDSSFCDSSSSEESLLEDEDDDFFS